MTDDPMQPRPRQSILLRWHRWVGAGAAIIILIVAVTGVLLNHAETLSLRRSVVDAPIILDHYQINPKSEPVSFRTSHGWVTWLANNLYVDGIHATENAGSPVGAVTNDLMIVAAARAQIILLSADSALIERIPQQSLPGPVRTIGSSPDGQTIIETDVGRYAADPDLLKWTETDVKTQWAQPSDPPPEIHDKVLESFRGARISADRLILDIHTGRLFGAWGPFIFDLAAILLVFLTVSGIVNWIRYLRSERATRRSPQQ